jgi:flagellar basal-body rod protein FlgC
MGVFDMLNISGSALTAERQRADVIAANMANADTTHTQAGGPYVRKEVLFSTQGGAPFSTIFNGLGPSSETPAGSVQVADVVDDPTPPVMRYEPGNPDANPNGYVAYPAINPVNEMVDLMGAVRGYQLNATAVGAEKQMITESIDILKST